MNDKAKQLGNEPVNISNINIRNELGMEVIQVATFTKREYFAAMAMQGILAQNYCCESKVKLAKMAVDRADALCEELTK